MQVIFNQFAKSFRFLLSGFIFRNGGPETLRITIGRPDNGDRFTFTAEDCLECAVTGNFDLPDLYRSRIHL